MSRRISFSIHPLFWLFAALLGYLWSGTWAGTLLWILVILVSVTIHELGHALTGLAFRQKVHIQLTMFGGATSRSGPRLALWKEFILTLNGPIAGYLLAAAAYGLLWAVKPASPTWAAILTWVLFINLFWSTVNLFPVLPLDGGHLLRIVLEAIFGAKGTAYALLIGVVLGGLITIFAFVVGWILAGAVFFLLTFESIRGWMAYRHVVEGDRDLNLQETFRQAEAAMQSGAVDRAISGFEHVRRRTGRGLLYTAATEALARLLSDKGEQEQAYQYLKEVRKQLSPQSLPLLQQLAFSQGDYETVIAVAKDCFQISPTYDVAWIAALAHAARQEVRPAIGWLECAIREGLPDVGQALADAKLDPIRKDPKFQEFTHSLQS
jgi:stage IV sporulation protein FB